MIVTDTFQSGSAMIHQYVGSKGTLVHAPRAWELSDVMSDVLSPPNLLQLWNIRRIG